LPDNRARRFLLRELFFPPADQLLQRYGKARRIWLPWLYLRYLATRSIARVSLK
jgi:hypothetical protein